MKVELIAKTDMGAEVAARAAAICTNTDDIFKALRGALASGHESVIEHVSYSFLVQDVSRILLAQLTRHRLASYSVMSQRYVNQENQGFVFPDSWNKLPDDTLEDALSTPGELVGLYCEMVDRGVPEEDARYILPQGIMTAIVMTMNARELRHLLELRCCNRAQWEIRKLADKIRAILEAEEPVLFKKSGCACQQGKPCPEGKRSCGKPRTQNVDTYGVGVDLSKVDSL